MSALPYGFSFGMAIFGKFDMSLTLSQLMIKWGIFANVVMCAYSVFAWQKHSARLLYWRVSFGVILSYTVLATFFTLESWLEPFGALVKNFVLLAVFYGHMTMLANMPHLIMSWLSVRLMSNLPKIAMPKLNP